MTKSSSNSDKPVVMGSSDFENLYAMSKQLTRHGYGDALRAWLLDTRPVVGSSRRSCR